MQIRKSRWSRAYESAEEELVELLARKNITAHRWTAKHGEEVADKQYAEDTQLWCAEGQLTCTLDGKTYSLQPGDVLDIPANVSCTIKTSFGGFACYESAYKPEHSSIIT